MEITLGQALAVAEKIKNGEHVAPIVVGGVTYYPRTAVKYLAGLTTGIVNNDLVVASNDKSYGERNINSDKLDFPFLVLGQRMMFDTSTGATVTAKNANWGDEAPVALRNGEMKITQGKDLSELPISVIANTYSPTSNNDDFFHHSPFLIRPQSSFEIKAIAVGAATANQAYRYEMIGIEFIKG